MGSFKGPSGKPQSLLRKQAPKPKKAREAGEVLEAEDAEARRPLKSPPGP